MSFLRPGAAAFLTRWRETALWAFLTLIGLYWLLGGSGWFFWLAAIVWGSVGLWLLRSAFLSALAAGRGAAPGVVSIDEQRISYFGPVTGGVISIDEIDHIGIDHGGKGWQVSSRDSGISLTIPMAATGAEGLIDAFAALPGFSPARALTMAGAGVTIWRREAPRGIPSLARIGGGD